jgi:hypothetical protein
LALEALFDPDRTARVLLKRGGQSSVHEVWRERLQPPTFVCDTNLNSSS